MVGVCLLCIFCVLDVGDWVVCEYVCMCDCVFAVCCVVFCNIVCACDMLCECLVWFSVFL